MDKLTFINNLIQTLVWPAIAVGVILLFKKAIEGLLSALGKKIQALTKAKHKGSEILFDTEKAISLIQNAEQPTAKKQNESSVEDIQQHIRNSKIEMGVSGCVLASVLIHLTTSTKIPRQRIHKCVGTALKGMIELLKECKPDSPNFGYYEEMLDLHQSTPVDK